MAFRGDIFEQLIPGVDDLPFEMLPVVESCPPKMIVIKLEAEGTNKPEFCADSDTGSPDTSRIMGDFRFQKHNMQAWSIRHRQGRIRKGLRNIKSSPEFPNFRLDLARISGASF
jgi:hypothetical protein